MPNFQPYWSTNDEIKRIRTLDDDTFKGYCSSLPLRKKPGNLDMGKIACACELEMIKRDAGR